jgi:hypothetical protein
VVLRHALFQAHLAEHRSLGILLAAHRRSGGAGGRSGAGVCLKTRAHEQGAGLLTGQP